MMFVNSRHPTIHAACSRSIVTPVGPAAFPFFITFNTAFNSSSVIFFNGPSTLATL